MSSSIQKQLEEVRHQINQVKLLKAFKQVENIIKTKDLKNEEKLRTLVLKGEILFQLGEFEEALEVLDGVTNSLSGKEPLIINLDAIILKLYVKLFLFRYDDFPALIKEGERLLKRINNLSDKKVAKCKSLFASSKAYQITSKEKDSEKGLEYAQEALRQAEISEDKSTIIMAQLIMTNHYLFAGKLEEVIKQIDKAAEIAEKYGNKMDKLYVKYILANKHLFLGDRKKALNILLDLENEAKKIGTKKWLVQTYLDCAIIYHRLFDYDKALHYMQKAEELGGYRLQVREYYSNFGQLYQIKGEFELAIENYKKALEWQKDVTPTLVPELLYNLLILSLELKKTKQAKDYLEQLKQVNQELDNKFENLVLYSEVSINKASSRMRDWTKANEILEQLLEKNDLDLSFQILITLDQSELLLKELQLSGDDELWEEVTSNIARLYDIAQDKQYVVLLIEIYRLQSQLELVELNPKKAISLLDQAFVLAKEKGMLKLATEIENTQQEIKKRLGFWEELSTQKKSIDERLKHVPLINSVQRVSHEAVVEERDEKTGEVIEYRKLFALKI